MKKIALSACMLLTLQLSAQQKSYYYQIPDTPAIYTPATVAARMLDGLGFRYYWATEGLIPKDLGYRASVGARTTFETLEHILGLTEVLFNAAYKKPNSAAAGKEKLSFVQLRERTLKNIQAASEQLKQPGVRLEELNMMFDKPGGKTAIPFWNLINGPISDALWHVGQVVSYRRASGNPLPKGVNFLTGTKTE
jgi:hypothetical protein